MREERIPASPLRVPGRHLESAISRWVDFVKLPHTVFALPFAFVGVVYASLHARVTLRDVLLVTIAFTGARFAAMGFNRIVDRDVDALNPRTRGRELPQGRLTIEAAGASVIIASVVFVGSAWLLNPLCFYLSPLALAWVLAYSYTKRLTHWSHLWLGASLAMAPAGGYLAVTGRWPDPWWTLPLIGLAVLTWVAGFDIFYALQDEEFDRGHGLKSAVVLLGRSGALSTAKVLHGLTVGLLFAFGWLAGFGAVFSAGVIAAAAVLVREHRLVRPGDLSRVNAAFFTMNGVMSVVVLLFAVMDRLL